MCVTKSKSKSHRWPRIHTQPGKKSSVITYRTSSIIPPFLILAGFQLASLFPHPYCAAGQQSHASQPIKGDFGGRDTTMRTSCCSIYYCAPKPACASLKSQASSNLINVALSARLKCNDPTTKLVGKQALLRFAVFERMSVSQHLLRARWN
jgi:hypothetical protein